MITTDEKILRIKCEDVKPEEVDELITILEKELGESKVKGIGLAASQIGIHKSIAIVRINDKLNVNLVNCKIEHGYDEMVFSEEGCLSLPGQKIDTKRFNEVHITGNLVYPHSFTATGILAVCIQHEIDHLNGILITDRVVKKIQKQPPNEKCACGSGLKFKKCCYRKV